jgi:hypothetical protein
MKRQVLKTILFALPKVLDLTKSCGRSDQTLFKPVMGIRFRAERIDFDVSRLPV